jgi:hypothetical protein
MRVEDVNLNFRDDIYEWKGGKGEKFNLKWRNDHNNCMTVKAESTVEISIMNLIAILYENEYYTDWVSYFLNLSSD